MNRFTKQPRRMTGVKYLISIGIFCVILFWFLGGLSSISKTTSEQELESLKQAVIRSCPVLCAGGILSGKSGISGRSLWTYL